MKKLVFVFLFIVGLSFQLYPQDKDHTKDGSSSITPILKVQDEDVKKPFTGKINTEPARGIITSKEKSTKALSLPFVETFDTEIPAGWTVIDGGTSSDTWFWTAYARGNTSNTLDGTPFAFVDSDAAGSSNTLNEILESPEINTLGYDTIWLQFLQYFNWISGYGAEVADVDVWDGVQWVNILRQNSADAGIWANPDRRQINITDYSNASLKVRFHYYDAVYDYYWAVDSVMITGTVSVPLNTSVTSINGLETYMEPGNYEVTAVVANTGLDSLTSFRVDWAVDNGSGYMLQSPVIWSDDTLYKGEMIALTLGSYIFNSVGDYSVKVWPSLPNGQADTVYVDDTCIFNVTIYPYYTGPYPFIENFDANDLVDNFWLNNQDNDLNWELNSGSTPSSGTGPDEDHTTGSGYYIYTEANNAYPNGEADIISRSFDLSSLSIPQLEFWYYMMNTNAGEYMGTLRVDVYSRTSGWHNNVFVRTGHQSEDWLKATVDLSSFADDTIKIRFRGITGTWSSDFAIDDIKIYEKPQVDIAVYNWLYPKNEVELGSSVNILVMLENTGVDTIKSFQMTFTNDMGATWSTPEDVTMTINPGQRRPYTFVTAADFSGYGSYYCCAKAILTGDLNADNDSAITMVTNYRLINTFPYSQGFEGSQYWHSESNGSNNSWEIGNPAGDFIYTLPPSGGSKCWMTDTVDYYNNSEESYVISPVFDLSGLQKPVFMMDLNFATESYWDYAVLEFSTDMGSNWEVVGTFNSGTNWYNNTTPVDPYGWSGMLGSWQTSSNNLDSLIGEDRVLLRVKFKSNAFTTYDGVAFDNVKIFDLQNDLEIADWIAPVQDDCGYSSDAVTILIKNNGTVAQTGFNVSYTVDSGATVITETVSGTIEPGETLEYTFTALPDLSHDTLYCMAVVALNDDQDGNNDTLIAYVEKGEVITIGYEQNFDGFIFGNYPNQEGWTCNTTGGYYWLAYNGPNPWGYATGSTGDHTTGSNNYVAAFGGLTATSGLEANFYTPCMIFEDTDTIGLKFFYHMFGADMGSLHLDLLNNGVWLNDIWSIHGQQQDSINAAWDSVTVSFLGTVTRARIRAIRGSGYSSDIWIDDVSLITSTEYVNTNDVGVSSINNPKRSILNTDPIVPSATIINNRYNSVSFDVIIQSQTYQDTVTVANLEGSAQTEIVFDIFQPVEGVDSILYVKTMLAGDNNPYNDSMAIEFITTDTSLTPAYCFLTGPANPGPDGPAMFYLEYPEDFFLLADQEAMGDFISAGSWVEGKWIAAGYNTRNLYEMNTETGERTVYANLGINFEGLAYDWTTHTLFGLANMNGDNYYELYAVDILTAELSLIGTLDSSGIFINLACNLSGELYAANIDDDYLYQINPVTAEATAIGSGLGRNITYAQDMEFNHYNDSLVMLSYTGGGVGGLCYLNTTTGIAGPYMSSGSGYPEVVGFAIPYVNTISEANIISYSLPGQLSGKIDHDAHTVTITMPKGTNVTNLIANFILSEGAGSTVGGVPQTSGVTANNFTSPVTYTITNGAVTQNWVVTITTPQVSFLSYSLPGEVSAAEIDDENQTIDVIVAKGTDFSSLVATFTLSSGAVAKVNNLVQASGVTPNDFTLPVEYYVVNGEDSIEWYVTVTEEVWNGTDILSYSLPSQVGSAIIDNEEHTIELDVEPSSNLSNLIASFTLSNGAYATIGATLQESGITANNFTTTVTYRVIADNGDFQDWDILVNRILYTGNSILTFEVAGQVGSESINNGSGTVSVDVEYGTDISDLRPDNVVISTGATISPSRTLRRDFSAGPVEYTVTSESGSSRVWSVTITVLTGVEEMQKDVVTIFPIPADNELIITCGDLKITGIRLLDITGKVVYQDLVNHSVSSEVKVNVADLTEGIYLIQLNAGSKVITQQVEIMHK
ncbi:MAG: T9SS type A sorting domain-containing protein [Bacteroidales bacterium]|nr:T9SS type A sorting domain-containing protein [Bacteroidales bacterium]